MKYLILRKRPGFGDDPFLEPAARQGGGSEFRFPFAVDSQELSDREVHDLRDDPNIDDVIPSMPFTLIKPVKEDTGSLGAQPLGGQRPLTRGNDLTGEAKRRAHANRLGDNGRCRGVQSVRRRRCYGGYPRYGDRHNAPCVCGTLIPAEDLMDFTVNDRGVAGSAIDVHGHGTHVAGTIFGREVTGTRICVAPGIKKVLIGKVLGPAGASPDSLLNAIEWASSGVRTLSPCR